MAAWKVVLLLDLALALGVGGGYLWWGREAEALRRELAVARATPGGPREFHGEGVIRAVIPDMGLVVITHDEIAGFMPAMTMGFRASSPKVYDAIDVGDAVRFTLGGVPPNVALTAIEKLPRR